VELWKSFLDNRLILTLLQRCRSLTHAPGVEPSTSRLCDVRSTTEPARQVHPPGGMILPPKWHSYGRTVAELCHKSGRILAQKWQNSATKVAEFWHKSGRIRPQNWQNSGTKVAEFWHKSGRILPQKWQNSARKVAEFCPRPGSIPDGKLPHFREGNRQGPRAVPRLLIYKQSRHPLFGSATLVAELCNFRGRIVPLFCQNCATFLPEFCHFCGRILPLLWQNSATFLPEFCHFCARILPLLCQNSATFVAEFCHFSARILPLLCQNSATFVTYFGHLGGRIVPLLVRRARLRGPVVQRAPPKRVVVGSIPGTVIRGGVATS
jgi:hypothetical protein